MADGSAGQPTTTGQNHQTTKQQASPSSNPATIIDRWNKASGTAGQPATAGQIIKRKTAGLTLLKARHHHRPLEGGPGCCGALNHSARWHALPIQHRTAAGAAAGAHHRGSTIGACRDCHPSGCAVVAAAAAGGWARAAGRAGSILARLPLHLRMLRCTLLRRPTVLHWHKIPRSIANVACAAVAAGRRSRLVAWLAPACLCKPGGVING